MATRGLGSLLIPGGASRPLAPRPPRTRRHASLSGCLRAGRQVLPIAAWGVLPALVTGWAALGLDAQRASFAGDFHYAFWPAGQHVLHGVSPYVDPGSPTIAHAIAFVYPALAALLFAPLALIPQGIAGAIFASLNLGAALLTLWVLDVRDWRLYGLLMLCPAVFSGWTLANVTLLLALGIATIWRYRDRPLLIGLLTAVLVSLKLFLWPLALWLLATRRYAALAYAAAYGLALNALAWGVLGFGELHRYIRLLHALAATEEKRGFSLITLALREGTSRQAAYALAFVVALGVAIGCVALGRRGRELSALALAIGVSLLATPIVQLHYFALLLVPLAVVRPRLGIAWALPLAMWMCASPAQTWQIAVALAIGGAMIAIAVRADRIGQHARKQHEPESVQTREQPGVDVPSRLARAGFLSRYLARSTRPAPSSSST